MSRAAVALLACLGTACAASAPRPPAAPTVGGIAGRVFDRTTGLPVAATLTAHDQGSLAVATSRTRADGGYQVDGLAPGTYDMVVVLTATTLQLTGVPVRAGRSTGFDVPVDLGEIEIPPRRFEEVSGDAVAGYRPGDLSADRTRFEGTVTDAVTLERVGGAVVMATSPALDEPATAITDDAGRYRFEALPPGTYALSAYYQVPRRGQIEVRRTGLAGEAGTALIVPIFIEVTGGR